MKKSVFVIKQKKCIHHHYILHIWINLCTIFQLKMTILICWTKFSQKECFRSKTEKVNTTNEFFIFKLFLVISFSLNMKFFYFLNQICSNSKHYHWILDFRNSLDTKFQLKLTILIFWTKFAKKGYFQSKAEKLNITIEFCIFELVQEPNFSA